MKESVIKLEKLIDGKKYEVKIRFQNEKISFFELIMNEIENKKRKELGDAGDSADDEISCALL